MANALPDPQAAYNVLQNEVSNQVFFQKLAQYGIQPANPAEASDLLELAGKLRVVDQSTKAAGAETSSFSQASQALDGIMQQQGFSNPIKSAAAAEESNALAGYAAQLMQRADIYDSVLSVKQAQADVVTRQLHAATTA